MHGGEQFVGLGHKVGGNDCSIGIVQRRRETMKDVGTAGRYGKEEVVGIDDRLEEEKVVGIGDKLEDEGVVGIGDKLGDVGIGCGEEEEEEALGIGGRCEHEVETGCKFEGEGYTGWIDWKRESGGIGEV